MRTTRFPPSVNGPLPPHPGKVAAFSLIEMVGVMGILAILLAALAPALMAAHDRNARDQEQKALESLAQGLRQHILTQRAIPDAAGFPNAVAAQLGWRLAEVTNNVRHQRRVLLFDPRTTNFFPLPYQQTALGLTNAIDPTLGVLFISSLGHPLPASLQSGPATSVAAFSNIWNCADHAVPSGWSWNGDPHDLRITRLSLGEWFVPLVLNYATYLSGGGHQGRFTLDASTTNTLPSTPAFTTRVLRGTVVGLHHHAGTVNTLQVSEVLQHPMSFVYEGDAWRGQLFLGRGLRLTSGLDLQAAHDLFLPAPHNVNAQAGANTTNVILALSNYMKAYVTWQGPPFNNSAYSALKAAQSELESVTSDMLHKPSGGGGGSK